MVVKQANITSYKVSDPSDILDRRPVILLVLACRLLVFSYKRPAHFYPLLNNMQVASTIDHEII